MKKIICTLLSVLFLFLLSACGQEQSTSESTTNTVTELSSTDKLYFKTTDLNNNIVTSDDFKNAKLIMLNLWEPWCGPCVNEMPGLQSLYEKYKDRGLVIIGSYETPDMEEDAKEIIEELGITYPIIHSDLENMGYLDTGSVPTTYFVDSNGVILNLNDPSIGALPEDVWESMILEYLQ